MGPRVKEKERAFRFRSWASGCPSSPGESDLTRQDYPGGKLARSRLPPEPTSSTADKDGRPCKAGDSYDREDVADPARGGMT